MAAVSRMIIAGEALIDLVPDAAGCLTPLAGGSPFNVAIGVGRLGVPATYLGTVSDDAFGDLLARQLHGANVSLALPTRSPRPTTLAMVHLDADGHAAYRFYLDGTSATDLRAHAIAVAAARDPSIATDPLHVSLGAVTLTTPGVGPVLADLLAHASERPFVSLDPNVRPAVIDDLDLARRTIESAVAKVDLVKVSDADLAALHPDRDPLAVAGEWARGGPALVVVTRGADGATAVRSEDGMLSVASLPIDVVDTVGAGDAFTSGLLATLDERGLLDRTSLRRAGVDELREVLAFAARVAAVACTRAGSDPPYRSELPA